MCGHQQCSSQGAGCRVPRCRRLCRLGVSGVSPTRQNVTDRLARLESCGEGRTAVPKLWLSVLVTHMSLERSAYAAYAASHGTWHQSYLIVQAARSPFLGSHRMQATPRPSEAKVGGVQQHTVHELFWDLGSFEQGCARHARTRGQRPSKCF